MNSKYNPWISMVALIVLILIIVTICTGCKNEAAETESRFTSEYLAGNFRIITDTETGVQYLAYTTAAGTGLTKLEVAEDAVD